MPFTATDALRREPSRSRRPLMQPAVDRNCWRDDWSNLRPAVGRHWPRLTGDDLALVSGSRLYLIDVICERYDAARDSVAAQVDAVLPRLWLQLCAPEALFYSIDGLPGDDCRQVAAAAARGGQAAD